jgi:hypothetical protein
LNGKFYARRPVVRQYQEGPLLAAEDKRLEEVSRGQDHMEVNY